MLESGTKLSGRYRVERVLGQGGMGAVYLARQEALSDKPVALKEMSVSVVDPAARTQAVEQFRQEASFLANLDHPNLVQVTDFFEEDGRYYLVMAYIKGENLGDLMAKRGRPFPLNQVLEWGRQLASVLGYLHAQQPPILFRDLKPSNIMLDEQERIRLIDFGIARVFQPEGVTATFLQGVGSSGYSPLEQYQGAGSTDPRSDIYSLGATLYNLLTNKVPPSPIELLSDGRTLPSPREWNPAVPPSFERAILRMMALRKDERFDSMDEVGRVLQQVTASLAEAQDSTDFLGAAAPTAANGSPTAPQPLSTAAAAAPAPAPPATVPSPAPAHSGGAPAWMWAAAGAAVMVLCVLFLQIMNRPTVEASAPPRPTPTAEVREPTPVATSRPAPVPTSRPSAVTSRPEPPVARPAPEPRVVRTVPRPEPPKPSPKPASLPASSYPRSDYPRARPSPKPEPEPVRTVVRQPVPQPAEPVTPPPPLPPQPSASQPLPEYQGMTWEQVQKKYPGLPRGAPLPPPGAPWPPPGMPGQPLPQPDNGGRSSAPPGYY